MSHFSISNLRQKETVEKLKTYSQQTLKVNKVSQGFKVGVKTLWLSTLGTAALVGAHHLGRKQYNNNAKLVDYLNGINEVFNSKVINKFNSSRYDTITDNPVFWVSGVAEIATNEYAVVAINETLDIVWQTKMPERVHDILIQPHSASYTKSTNTSKVKPQHRKNGSDSRHIAVMGRRPSEFFWILDTQSGRIIHSIKAMPNRHFYGHACYSLMGDVLYVTENNTLDYSGVIGVYDVHDSYKKIAEFATHGIGPHELLMHNDGNTLVIANGGIKTEKASREELNVDSMQPSLVYIDRHSGELLEQIYPMHNQMSVRHLAIHEDGTVIIGIQFQGERHLSVPLVLTHQRGEPQFTPLHVSSSFTNSSNEIYKDSKGSKGWHRFHHYIASVAVDSASNLACVTSPVGGCVAVFDLNTKQMMGLVELADCAGVATYHTQNNLPENLLSEHTSPENLESIMEFNETGFLVSDGQGNLTKLLVQRDKAEPIINVEKVNLPYAFDNHLNRVIN